MKWILILESRWPKSDEGIVRMKKENKNNDGKRENQKTELKITQ